MALRSVTSYLEWSEISYKCQILVFALQLLLVLVQGALLDIIILHIYYIYIYNIIDFIELLFNGKLTQQVLQTNLNKNAYIFCYVFLKSIEGLNYDWEILKN